MLKKKNFEEEFFFSKNMTHCELLNKTKRLINNSNSFNKYMRNSKEENNSSHSSYSKLPSLIINPLCNSKTINQKRYLGHSSSSYLFKKSGMFNESMVASDKKEYYSFNTVDLMWINIMNPLLEQKRKR
jgi:hypothetical protein